MSDAGNEVWGGMLPELLAPANIDVDIPEFSHCCQQAHNIKVQQMLHFVLFDLWRFGSKCWTIYICYKHSVAATFIMASIRVAVAYLSRFIVLFIIILITH